MRAWLIVLGEPVPTDPDSPRLWRVGLLAKQLNALGHDVVWWSSTFNHSKKTYRFEKDTDIQLSDRLELKCLHTSPYRKSVSLSRILSNRRIARNFLKHADRTPRPDVILCAFPPIEWAAAVTKWGMASGIPVVLDVRDLWPEAFLDLAPAWSRPLARLVLSPMFSKAKGAFRQATAIVGNCPGNVEWALHRAGRTQSPFDCDFPHGYTENAPSSKALSEAEAFWESQGVRKSPELIATYLGVIGNQSEFETIVEAARILEVRKVPVRFVLCGTGDRIEEVRRLAEGLKSVVLPGWVGAAQVWTLLRRSSVGLTPFRSSWSFSRNLPNKPIEYFSAGLPVLSSLKGFLQSLLAENDCGWTYPNRDPQALAEALATLHGNPEKLEAMSRNAAALYRRRYVAEEVYARMAQHLEKVAGRNLSKS